MEAYPVVTVNAGLKELVKSASYIQRLREDDISDFSNLVNVFMSGRKVNKIPASSADVVAGDRVGDFNYSAAYLYLVVDNTGAEWRRIALGSW